MSFQLNVTFLGMCLLVEDKRGTASRLQVLLPSTKKPVSGPGDHDHHRHGGHDQADEDVHLARLAFYGDRRKEDGDQGGGIEQLPLEHLFIDFPNLQSSHTFGFNPSKDLPNVNSVTRRRVPESMFDRDAGGRVLARVAIEKGEEGWHHPGGRWRLGNDEPANMAIASTWTVDPVEADSLEVRLSSLDGSTSAKSMTLYPDVHGRLNLYVFHTPKEEIPTVRLPDCWPGSTPYCPWGDPPMPDQPADHFAYFYRLYDGVASMPLPRFVEPWKCPEEAAASPEAILGTKLTCVTGTGST